MITFVYASRATRPLSDDELTSLLAAACDRNESHDVTGMLLYARESFLQQLEGDGEAVEEIFQSISVDERHTDIRLLSRRSISDRGFPEWRMGFEHPDAASLSARLPGYDPPGNSPLVDAEIVESPEVAEALLGLYALDGFR